MSSLAEQLRVSFEAIGCRIDDPLVMTKCMEVCTAHGLSSQQLANSWDAFSVNNKVKELSMKVWDKFRVEVAARFPKKTPSKPERPSEASTPSSGAGGASLSASLFGRYGMAAPPSAPATPMESKKRPMAAVASSMGAVGNIKAESMFASSPGSQSTPGSGGGAAASASASDNYVKRRGAGEVRLHYNSQLADVVVMGASTSVKKVISVHHVAGGGVEKPYKYMWDPLEVRAAAFKDTVARLGNFMLSKHEDQLSGLELSAFHLPRTDEVLCFGRICSDGTDSKMEARAVLIEGQAPENDNIYRVKLDLKHCPSFALFPGQTVLLRGVNPTGSSLVVKKLFVDAALPVAVTDESQVYDQGTVKVTIAAGPFCSSENLEYRPLSDLMDVVLSNGTDVLVLMGPFVDSKHPNIERGDIGRTYDELFEDVLQHHVLRRVDAHNSTAARGKLIQRVVLVPSLQDIHHHSVFPQFPYSMEPFAVYREFLMALSNPCQLSINGITFGFTSVDPLKHMGGSVLLQRSASDGAAGNRLLDMASLLVEQQSFLPLNPPPTEIPLDTSTNLVGVEFSESTPQVLVLPSALKEFADPVKGSLVVNPSFLVRSGSGGGTYAEVILYPKGDDGEKQPMDTGADESSVVPAAKDNFMSRIEVKVVKI